MMCQHFFNFKTKMMIDNKVKEEFQMATTSELTEVEESGRSPMSNDELRELLHQHAGIL